MVSYIMANSRRTYSQVLNTYLVIILIIIMMVAIFGVLAVPYYISPITYFNGGVPQATGLLVLGSILVAMLLAGIYLLERRQIEFGSFLIIFAVMILAILIWEQYGVSSVSNIIHNI